MSRPINFTDTTVVKKPYVEINGIEYEVQDGTYTGGTDLNANTFNKMQDELNPFRNILQNKNPKGYSTTINGITYTINDDYSITLNGTATSTSYIQLTDIFNLNGTYTLGFGSNIQSAIFMRGLNIDNSYSVDFSTRDLSTNTVNSRYIFYLYVAADSIIDNVKVYPQLEENTVATSYVPFVPYNVDKFIETSLSELANNCVFTDMLPANYDLLDLYNSIGLKISKIDNATLNYVNFPSGAYGYGVLITICNSVGASWNNAQIYITDGIGTNDARGLYIRTKDSTWIRITGTIGIANTTAS